MNNQEYYRLNLFLNLAIDALEQEKKLNLTPFRNEIYLKNIIAVNLKDRDNLANVPNLQITPIDILVAETYDFFIQLIERTWVSYHDCFSSIFPDPFSLIFHLELTDILASTEQNLVNPNYFVKKQKAVYNYLRLRENNYPEKSAEINTAKRQILKGSINHYSVIEPFKSAILLRDEMILFASESKDPIINSAYCHFLLAHNKLLETSTAMFHQRNRRKLRPVS